MKFKQYLAIAFVSSTCILISCKTAETSNNNDNKEITLTKKANNSNAKAQQKVGKVQQKVGNTANKKNNVTNKQKANNIKKSIANKTTNAKNNVKRRANQISGKELTKYHMDQIKIINTNFSKKIKSTKNPEYIKAFRLEKELALKRFLGDDLFKKYKAKISR